MGSHGLLIEVADLVFGEPKCDGLQAIDAATLGRIVSFAREKQAVSSQESGVRSTEGIQPTPALNATVA
jgi:hypothetical protein